jgi:hypothetical protein
MNRLYLYLQYSIGIIFGKEVDSSSSLIMMVGDGMNNFETFFYILAIKQYKYGKARVL